MRKISIYLMFVVALCTPGCDDTKPAPITVFPTNSFRVVSVVDGEVIVESTSTNIATHLRVVRATAVGRLTNGQPARVEMTLRGQLRFVSAKAFPSID